MPTTAVPLTRRPATLLPAAREVGADARPALLTADGRALSHGELRSRVADLAASLPDADDGRLLVHLPLRTTLEHVLAYLAVVEAGHVALVTADDARADAILGRYTPDVVLTGRSDDAPFDVVSRSPQHLLHPDLALLLSTSGSTGSPKLVRLSRTNLASNATGIATALGLTADDRGLTSLPLTYCFGLSVLHSHLAVGASVVVDDGSLLEERTWRLVDGHGVTNLAVVPHTVELLEGSGELERPHPSLRLIAQAGGRLAPERVARVAALGREHGWALAPMYGQTEATARICVLDPALTSRHPDAVGRPVAGTTLHLDTTVPEAQTRQPDRSDAAGPAGAVGEVVVRGPGVMLGYAEHPDDLALGPMLTELRTGDLGHVDEHGLLRIVGRRSGFVKVMGLRVDLARVESQLEAAGLRAAVGGDDAGLAVVVEPVAGQPSHVTAGTARRLAGAAAGIGPASVAVAVVPLPRLANGKVDRIGVVALARSGSPQACEQARHAAAAHLGADPTLEVRVAHELADVLALEAVDLDRSFVEQGGDSLSHVQASVRLERLLGALPRDWHHRRIGELVELGRVQQRRGRWLRWRGWRGWRGWRSVETSVLMRCVAAVLIVASHGNLISIEGGAHALLAAAGFNAARFLLGAPTPGHRWRHVGRTAIGIAVPTMVVAYLGLTSIGRYDWSNVFMVHWLVGDPSARYRNELWFVDALLACLVLSAALLSVPRLHQARQRSPWRVAAGAAALGLVPRFAVLHDQDNSLTGVMPTTFWLFAAGAAAAHADTRPRRAATLALAALGGATFFDGEPVRNALIVLGVAALVLLPRVPVPAVLVPAVASVASASLYIYLVQFQVLGRMPTPLTATAAALAVGLLAWRLADTPVRWLQRLVPLTPRTPPNGRTPTR